MIRARHPLRFFLTSLLLALVAPIFSREAPAQLVAPTGPLSPEEERARLQVPDGFEIQLVASEPQIHKPMNLNFDAAGRLWVTHSLEYPFAASDPEQARDAVTILSDLGPDGRARRIERFAERLNIPIGIQPLGMREAAVWSIPHIYRLTDRDGDRRAESREVLLGPFAYEDTHGNQNSFTRWIDGWIYACHGFRNHSRIKLGGAGDVVLELQSGNTYRFRPDGSAIEQWTAGQVNPFGLTFDPLGNIYTADCHSRPLTMLLRGGCYPSFGKPDDGLGFAPEMMRHDHGSTGLAGACYYAADHFPAEFRDSLFVGNVVTGRIHRDRIRRQGSTYTLEAAADLVVSHDPWFRPVDIQLGPDGALYIADFYNKIIGHYEVPLDHPERDRHRGRIWRIVRRGSAPSMPDLTRLGADELIDKLGEENLLLRVLATHELVDRCGTAAIAPARARLHKGNDFQRAHVLWVLSRLDSLDSASLASLANDRALLVRVHLLKALGESTHSETMHAALARAALEDPDAFVRRAAVDALARHPDAANLAALLECWAKTPAEDAMLIHAIRIALRDQFADPRVAAELARLELEPVDRQRLVPIAAAVENAPAARFVYEQLGQHDLDPALLTRLMTHLGRQLDDRELQSLVLRLQKRFHEDLPRQGALLESLHDGMARGGRPTEVLRSWALALAEQFLASQAALNGWSHGPLPGQAGTRPPWVLQERPYADGQTGIPLLSSLSPGGEQLTGIAHSPAFAIPSRLSFFMAGHNGPPPAEHPELNYVRLVVAETGEEIARSVPPRSDTAQPFTWDLGEYAGQQGILEVVDGQTGSGWAWLAVSRFEPAVVKLPSLAPATVAEWQEKALQLVADFRLSELATQVGRLATNRAASAGHRLAAADVLHRFDSQRAEAVWLEVLCDSEHSLADRCRAAELLASAQHPAVRTRLVEQLCAAPQQLAAAIAATLVSKPDGAAELLREIREGRAAPLLLHDAIVSERLGRLTDEELKQQAVALAANLPPHDEMLARSIEQHRSGFRRAESDAGRGKEVFQERCAACHARGTLGNRAGPTLDAVATRGAERLLEDVLDPSRNVDRAFRTVVIATSDGRVQTGWGVREEGETLVMFDPAGKPVRIALADIVERADSNLSPMPSNFAELLSPQQLYDLVAYLLSGAEEGGKQ